TAWCHGSSGIGLARLTIPQDVDPHGRTAVRIALREALCGSQLPDDSLCHGNLANLELVMTIGHHFRDAALVQKAQILAVELVKASIWRGWRSGHPTGLEIPGLFTGLSGIGYGLLRLADPDRTPSVLLLEPPPQDSFKHKASSGAI
ncbi:MAG: lanthionine synthetase LanC family protein, partial [Anaerolineae bacterium]